MNVIMQVKKQSTFPSNLEEQRGTLITGKPERPATIPTKKKKKKKEGRAHVNLVGQLMHYNAIYEAFFINLPDKFPSSPAIII